MGRFVRTILYFNPPPSPIQFLEGLAAQPLAALRAITGSSTEVRPDPALSSVDSGFALTAMQMMLKVPHSSGFHLHIA